MKCLIFILFLFDFVCGYGQKYLKTESVNNCAPYDTVRVAMLTCDTVNMGSKKIDAQWQYGFEVTEARNCCDAVFYNKPQEVFYLDADKNRLSKNTIVWVCKILE